MPKNANGYRAYLNARMNGEPIKGHWYYEAAIKARRISVHARNADALATAVGKMLQDEQTGRLNSLITSMQANAYMELHKFLDGEDETLPVEK